MKFKWSKEQTDFVKKNYSIYGAKFCSRHLPLTVKQICKKAERLSLKRIERNAKICPMCLQDKLLSEYNKNRSSHSGLASRCKECCKKITKQYRLDNPEKYHLSTEKQSKKYHLKNKNNLQYKIKKRLRTRIYYALRGASKFQTTFELLGCTYQEFIQYFKSKMTLDMTWQDVLNGKIHIDHIKPCSSFDLSDFEQQKICFHYSNLQPLWAFDNLSKNDTYATTQ